jgi:hypothetical protein
MVFYENINSLIHRATLIDVIAIRTYLTASPSKMAGIAAPVTLKCLVAVWYATRRGDSGSFGYAQDFACGLGRPQNVSTSTPRPWVL